MVNKKMKIKKQTEQIKEDKTIKEELQTIINNNKDNVIFNQGINFNYIISNCYFINDVLRLSDALERKQIHLRTLKPLKEYNKMKIFSKIKLNDGAVAPSYA